MDFNSNISHGGYQGGDSKVQTKAIRVMVTTDEYEVEGYLHIKPGGYQSRVSDLLNSKGLQYIAITHAQFRSLRHPDAPLRQADTLILKLDTVKMVVPENGQDRQIPNLEGGVSQMMKPPLKIKP